MDSLSKSSDTRAMAMTAKNFSFLTFNSSCTIDFWIIDSGATDHMTPDMSYLSCYSPSCDKHCVPLQMDLKSRLAAVVASILAHLFI